MTAIKKICLAFFISFSCISIWYLFIKANDFEVIINVETAPGTVYQNILDWNKNLNLDKARTVVSKKEPFNNIVNTYDFESHKLEFNWNMTKINDSITQVSIGVNDLNNSIATRIKKLIGTSPIEKFLNQEFSGFNKVLTRHLKAFTVKIDGKANSPEGYVAYVHISCNQGEKANNMINNSMYINTFIIDHGLKLKSKPFVEITDWNIHTGQIDFNFCFPIDEQPNFPFHKEIKYKKVTAKKSMKATFHGNYSYTQNAWHALYEYVKSQEIKPLKTITEVFYDNPHTGGKDATWKAEIFMEIE